MGNRQWAGVGLMLTMGWLPVALVARPGTAAAQGAVAQEPAMLRLAQAYEEAAQFDKAAPLYEDLLRRRPGNGLYIDRLINAYTQLKRYDDAARMLTEQAAREPKNPVPLAQLGGVRYRAGDESGATEAWGRAVALAPTEPGVYRLVATVMLDNRLLDQAATLYRSGRTKLGDPTAFTVELATLLGATGDVPGATTEYLHLLGDDEGQLPFVQTRIATLTEQPDERQRALATIRTASARAKANRALHALLAWLLTEAGDYPAALTEYRTLDATAPIKGVGLVEFGHSALSQGRADVARSAFAEVVRLYPTSAITPRAMLGLAEANAQSTPPDPSAAAAAYRRYLERYPTDPNAVEARLSLAALELDVMNDPAGAQTTLEPLTRTGGPPKARLLLGDARFRVGDEAGARAAYESVLMLPGRSETGDLAGFRLAELEYFGGQFDSALVHLGRLSRVTSSALSNDAIELSMAIGENRGSDKGAALARFARAQSRLRQRDAAGAERTLDSLQSAVGHGPLADDVRFALATARVQLGRPEQAVAALRSLVDEFPLSLMADDALKTAAELTRDALHDGAKAATLYEELLVRYPGSPYAAEARARVRALRGDGPAVQ